MSEELERQIHQLRINGYETPTRLLNTASGFTYESDSSNEMFLALLAEFNPTLNVVSISILSNRHNFVELPSDREWMVIRKNTINKVEYQDADGINRKSSIDLPVTIIKSEIGKKRFLRYNRYYLTFDPVNR